MVKTGMGLIFFTFYTMFLFAFLLFTGVYGFIKCKQNDFTGCVLRCSTFLVPISGIFAIIIYFTSITVPLSVIWMKLIVDIITVIIGVILILYLTGLIKTKKKYDNKTEVLLSNEDIKA